VPPPTIDVLDALWCGDSKGGRTRKAPKFETPKPASECTALTSRASPTARSGNIVGNRSASIVLPAPGGPTIKTWCAPTADTNSASTMSGCPSTSAMSICVPMANFSKVGALVSLARESALLATTPFAPWILASSARCPIDSTSMPPASSASIWLAIGTTICRTPAALAAITIGNTPRTGRSDPSSASSPMCAVRATDDASQTPAATKIETAMPTSNAEPNLGTLAGERFTVMRLAGNAKPELAQAARTRSLASLSDASGKPTKMKFGRLLETSASISIRVPESPNKLTARVRPTVIKTPIQDARL
jgi:hypothetical protein